MTTGPDMNRRDALRAFGAAVGSTLIPGGLGAAAQMTAAASKPAGNKGPAMSDTFRALTWYYQHHDADLNLDVPEEAFGGWKKAELEFSRKHTAVVSMHAWDMGTPQQFPGWYRTVPYGLRANRILRDVFPRLLTAVRASGLTLFHVVGGGDYYRNLPGYKRAAALAGPEPTEPPGVQSDPVRERLNDFRNSHVFLGRHNEDDVKRGFARLDFPPQARPQGDEGVAENGRQLLALCKEKGVNHLVYCGFAINWCLLLSPGGMAEMQKYGLMCSALRQATAAVENKETARGELCKEEALWRVALAYGFVFDVDDFIGGISAPDMREIRQ